MKKNRSIFLLINALCMVLFVWLDQFTKELARTNLSTKTVVLIDEVLELKLLENYGAAFGILEGKQFLLIIEAVLVILLLVVWLCRIPMTAKYYKLVLLFDFIIAGGAGNMIDRIQKNTVTDFIYFKCIDFPIFNVADIYVTVSVILLVLLCIFAYKEEDFAFMSLFRKKEAEKEE